MSIMYVQSVSRKYLNSRIIEILAIFEILLAL